MSVYTTWVLKLVNEIDKKLWRIRKLYSCVNIDWTESKLGSKDGIFSTIKPSLTQKKYGGMKPWQPYTEHTCNLKVLTNISVCQSIIGQLNKMIEDKQQQYYEKHEYYRKMYKMTENAYKHISWKTCLCNSFIQFLTDILLRILYKYVM